MILIHDDYAKHDTCKPSFLILQRFISLYQWIGSLYLPSLRWISFIFPYVLAYNLNLPKGVHRINNGIIDDSYLTIMIIITGIMSSSMEYSNRSLWLLQ